MLSFIKYMEVIYFYWAYIPLIPAFMSKLMKIDIFIIKHPFVTTLFIFLHIFGLLLILQHSIGIVKVIA